MHLLPPLLFLVVFVNPPPTVKGAQKEDIKLSVPTLIRKYGYPFEQHTVTTPDGYVLTMHRIPPRTRNAQSRPVLYQHGLLCSSADIVLQGPKTALAYLLADAGFDVWMTNSRGNRYSRQHKFLDHTSSPFWDFSWHEIGLYDVPATIDYILARTGQRKLFYIGYSQGAITFFVMTSMRPEYNRKIIAHISMGPAVFMTNAQSPILRFVAFWSKPMRFLFDQIGHREFLPGTDLLTELSKPFCKIRTIPQFLCKHILCLFAGFNSKVLNVTLFSIALGHYPAGASTKQIVHYGQVMRYGDFRQYDYGQLKNVFMYGSLTPPKYDLTKTTVPLYFLVSKNDWLSSLIDVNRLCREVRSGVVKIQMEDPSFNHMDFVFGKDIRKNVYLKMLNIINQYGQLAANVRRNGTSVGVGKRGCFMWVFTVASVVIINAL